MKISVIVPIYNAGELLHRSIDSILQQKGVDFELILVDDGSTDNSPAICDEVAARHDNVRVIHKDNGGVSTARNAGIEAAQGDYLCFVDSDDELLPEALLNMWQCVAAHPGVDLVQAPFVMSDEFTEYGKAMPDFTNDRNFIRSHSSYELLGFSACSKLVKRQLVIDNNLRFAEGIAVGEDPLFIFFVHKMVTSVAQCRVACYHYVANPQSVMHEKDRTKHILGALQVAAIAAQHFTTTDGQQVEAEYIHDKLTLTRLREAWNCCDHQRVRQQISDTYRAVSTAHCPLALKLMAWRLTLPYRLAVSPIVDLPLRVVVKLLKKV